MNWLPRLLPRWRETLGSRNVQIRNPRTGCQDLRPDIKDVLPPISWVPCLWCTVPRRTRSASAWAEFLPRVFTRWLNPLPHDVHFANSLCTRSAGAPSPRSPKARGPRGPDASRVKQFSNVLAPMVFSEGGTEKY